MGDEDRPGASGSVPSLERESERGPAFTAEQLAMIDQLIAARVSASTDPPPSGTVDGSSSTSHTGEL